MMKRSGPRIDPWGTPDVTGRALQQRYPNICPGELNQCIKEVRIKQANQGDEQTNAYLRYSYYI